jgi:type IV pilus assembly protein PilQ
LTAVSSSLLPNQQLDKIPIQEERATESHVLLHDGQTLVVGGIYRLQSSQDVSGFPFLQSIPGLGWLFGGVAHSNNRQDLLIFVTPHQVPLPYAASGDPLPPAQQLWLNRTVSGGS